MTYNPDDLLEVRGYLLAKLDLMPGVARGVDLEPGEVGIAGDPAHAASGGYHEGNDDLARVGLLSGDYSKRESARDRPGTNAASALDIGEFDAVVGGRRITLRSLSLAIVDACRRGDPRTRDIREVIYSPNGSTVSRWDRLGIRSSGDSSHLWHTHLGFFRDSEGRRHRDDNILGLLREIIEGDDMAFSGDPMAEALAWRGDALAAGSETVRGGPNKGEPMAIVRTLNTAAWRMDALMSGSPIVRGGPTEGEEMAIIRTINDIAEKVAAIAAQPPGTVTVTDEQLERVMRRVIGSVDGASPAAS